MRLRCASMLPRTQWRWVGKVRLSGTAAPSPFLPARSAFTKNYQVLFLSDGTATASKAMHDASLLNLGYGFARIHTCAKATALVKAAAAEAGLAAVGAEAAEATPRRPPRR